MQRLAVAMILAILGQSGMVGADIVPRPKARPPVLAQSADVPSNTPPAILQLSDPSALAVEKVPPQRRAADSALPEDAPLVRPPTRRRTLPVTRWQHMEGHALWTQAALSALKSHGKPLVETVPADIAQWCPAYRGASDARRRAFWVGFLSALAKYESTYKPWAVGGGGRWFGLLQILPATARGYRCNAETGTELRSGAANLSCAVRIMARTVPRDGVIHSGGEGVAADWAPLRSTTKRQDMANWLKRQSYCRQLSATRPKARP